MNKFAQARTGLTLVGLMLCGSILQAQTASENTASASSGLEEIIVTAQRREQSLQDAAVAVQVYDQNALTQAGIESAQDLGSISPALGVSAGGGPLTSFFVRGVGALTVNPLTDSAIAANVDGVYLGRSSGAAGTAIFDLERVELLKGPQGTLYGRNATGGVINFIPQKPVIGEQSGYVQGELGEFSKRGLEAAVNVPLSETTALRIAGNYINRDGYSDDGTNDRESYSVRGQLLLEPSAELSVRIAVDHSDVSGVGPGGDLFGTFSNTPGSLTDFTPSGLAIDSGPTAAGANAIRGNTLHTPSFAPFQPIDRNNLFQELTYTGVMAEINYSSESGTLTFIPAYRESEHDYQFSGPGFAPAKTLEENSQTSFELRYATDFDGRFNGIIGAFYIDEDISTSGVFAQNFASPIQNYDNGGDSWAVFGQGTFDVSDDFRLNAGIRYTRDNKFVDGISDTFVTFCGGAPATGNFLTPGPPPFNSFVNGCASGAIPAHPITSDRDAFIADLVSRGVIAPDSVATVPGNGPPPIYNFTLPGGVPPTPGNPNPVLGAIVNVGDGALRQELEFDEVTFRLSAEWDWGPSNLLYANFETGYRAGGVDLSSASPTYDPEFIDAFTIGSKNRFLDNTLQINAEAFIWKYDDQQVTYFTTLDSASAFPIANGDATIKGLDVDVVWAMSDNTTIGGNFQILDSVYDSLELISDPGRGRFGCPSSGVTAGIETYNCSGNSLLFSPDFGADLNINHIVNIANYDVSLTGNLSYRAEQQTNFLLLDETEADSYVSLNLDVAFSPRDADWVLSVFVQNATDERYSTNTNVSNRGLAYTIFSPPRTYGVRLRADF